MNPVLISPGVTAESIEENGKLALRFSITHSKMDRANIITFPITFISLAGFLFLCFLYGAIISRELDILVFELSMILIITLCVFWAKVKLKKVPKNEVVTVNQNGSQLEFHNSVFNTPRVYDLKDIKGAWIYEYFVNGNLMAVYIVLSQTDGKKRVRDNSPILVLPVALSTSKKLYSMYRLILLYIGKNYPWVNIGYDDSSVWESIKKILL
jgi:hypothetical protein